MAEGLAEAGADVCAIDVLPCDETCGSVARAGRHCHSIRCDLGDVDPECAERLVSECVAQLGGVDVVCNNAGIIRRSPALEFPADDWDSVLRTNLYSAFYLSQAAARQFVDQGRGKIINTASVLSFQGGILAASYTASKSALAGLTRVLACEWAPHGINVNAIAPGYLRTELTVKLQGDLERSEALLERIPCGRWGEPADVKGAVVFLASDAASYIHGAIVPVDGGWLAR
jgi:2-deoxy-D-gluconate 3-dehydrogenase